MSRRSQMAESQIVDAVVELNPDAARALTDQIKTGVEAVWQLVSQAYTERAWAALGYRSWDDYLVIEFGRSRLQLPREDRTGVVSSMRESGMSTRAIAAATGLSQPTISRELSRDSNESPAKPVDVEVDELAEELIAAEPELPPLPENYMVQPPKPITGLDGKTYTRPAPKPPQERKPKRRPITDQFDAAVYDLGKVTQRLARLAADERFDRNRSKIASTRLSFDPPMNWLVTGCRNEESAL